jgi:hypothetical protein
MNVAMPGRPATYTMILCVSRCSAAGPARGSVLEEYRIIHDVLREEDARYDTDCEIKPRLPILYRSRREEQRGRDEGKAHDKREPRFRLGIPHLI